MRKLSGRKKSLGPIDAPVTPKEDRAGFQNGPRILAGNFVEKCLSPRMLKSLRCRSRDSD